MIIPDVITEEWVETLCARCGCERIWHINLIPPVPVPCRQRDAPYYNGRCGCPGFVEPEPPAADLSRFEETC